MQAELIPQTLSPEEVLRAVVAARDNGDRVALATVTARSGSAPSTPGQKMALVRRSDADAAFGTVGGGAVEKSVLAALHEALEQPPGSVLQRRYALGSELGMCCGGAVDFMIEVLGDVFSVLIVGAGHVGLATATLLARTAFPVLLVDARETTMVPARLADARAAGVATLCAEHDDPEVASSLTCARSSVALLTMTHDHQLDQQVVEWGLRQGFGFVGGVGSRAKAIRTQKRLLHRGFSADQVASVEMPLGLSIGARTPEELAVSIVGGLVKLRSERLGRRQTQEGRRQTAEPEPAADRPSVAQRPA